MKIKSWMGPMENGPTESVLLEQLIGLVEPAELGQRPQVVRHRDAPHERRAQQRGELHGLPRVGLCLGETACDDARPRCQRERVDQDGHRTLLASNADPAVTGSLSRLDLAGGPQPGDRIRGLGVVRVRAADLDRRVQAARFREQPGDVLEADVDGEVGREQRECREQGVARPRRVGRRDELLQR